MQETTPSDIAGRKPTKGYVYVAFNPAWPGTCKVGVTKVIAKRLTQYNCGDPYRMYDMRGWRKFDDAYAVEKHIHTQLDEFRMAGEWFALHPDVAFGHLTRYEETENVE